MNAPASHAAAGATATTHDDIVARVRASLAAVGVDEPDASSPRPTAPTRPTAVAPARDAAMAGRTAVATRSTRVASGVRAAGAASDASDRAETADDVSGGGDAAGHEAFVRPVSIRAPRPAALVAQARRRRVLGVGVAASAALLATSALALPGLATAPIEQSAGQAAQASLLTGDVDVTESVPPSPAAPAAQPDESAGPGAEAGAAAADGAAPVAGLADYEVTSFGADAVSEVVPEPVAPVPSVDDEADAADVDAGAADAGSDTGDDWSGDSGSDGSGGDAADAGSGSGSGAESTSGTGTGASSGTDGASGGGGGGGVSTDLSGVAATAQSYVGSGAGWQCDYFVMVVMAEHGISMPRGVTAQASMGTRTSDPQPGDLVVWPGQHIGIYAGNGHVIDNPGYGGKSVQYRPIWGNPYFVTL